MDCNPADFAIALPGDIVFLQFKVPVTDEELGHFANRATEISKALDIQIVILPHDISVAKIEGDKDV